MKAMRVEKETPSDAHSGHGFARMYDPTPGDDMNQPATRVVSSSCMDRMPREWDSRSAQPRDSVHERCPALCGRAAGRRRPSERQISDNFFGRVLAAQRKPGAPNPASPNTLTIKPCLTARSPNATDASRPPPSMRL